MLGRDDLRAAVAAGIVTEAQAASLSSLAHSRNGARENLAPGDEPFELFKGFNEIFIVIGFGILTSGYIAVAGLWVALGALGNPISAVGSAAALGAVVVWLFSEYFIRRRRMVAPAIALSIMWAACASTAFTAWMGQVFMLAQEDYSSLPVPMACATVAVLVHWLRFKVPFSLAIVACGTFLVAVFVAASSSGTPDGIADLFLLSAGGPFAWITLALGGVVFAMAMMFDMSDPHRVTRRSANGFWLHVIAAPALVNTTALSFLDQDTGLAHALLLLALTLFAVIAIIIDRRSFLIAAVGYSATLAFIVFDGEGGAYTLFALGLGLVLLGAFWERLRAVLLHLLGPILPLSKLPPSMRLS